MFRPDQLAQLRQTSLARVICDNSDDIRELSRDVFLVPSYKNGRGEGKGLDDEFPQVEKCESLPSVALELWSGK